MSKRWVLIVSALLLAGCATAAPGRAERGDAVPRSTAASESAEPSTERPEDPEGSTDASVDATTTSPSTEEPEDGGGATAIRLVSPFTEDGRLAFAVDTENGPRGDHCRQSPVRDGRLLECETSPGKDATCWPVYVDAHDMVLLSYCMESPDSDLVVEIFESGYDLPMPVEIDDVVEDAEPWRIVLVDGVVCEPWTGATTGTFPDGFTVAYACDGNSPRFLLADENGRTLVRDEERWLAWSPHGQESSRAVQEQVAEVVFAGPTIDEFWAKTGDDCPSVQDLADFAPPGWTAFYDEPVSCAGEWAVIVGEFDDEPPGLPAPIMVTREGDTWAEVDTSRMCEFKQGLPVYLLQWCYFD